MNLFAYTATGGDYPGYVSINRNADGDVVVWVRSAPTPVKGSRVCGQTCQPGGPYCNNYCNHEPGEPMPDSPERHSFNREGVSASFTVPADQWESKMQRSAAKREDVLPALLRPGMYTGFQGDRTEAEWNADAVVAYLNAKARLLQV